MCRLVLNWRRVDDEIGGGVTMGEDKALSRRCEQCRRTELCLFQP